MPISGAAWGDFGFSGRHLVALSSGRLNHDSILNNGQTDADTTSRSKARPACDRRTRPGVHPIMVSPPARLQGIPIPNQSSLHAAAAQAVATANNVPFINLTALSTAWYDGLQHDPNPSAAAYHANGTDATHTNLAGAANLAGLVANAIKTGILWTGPVLEAVIRCCSGRSCVRRHSFDVRGCAGCQGADCAATALSSDHARNGQRTQYNDVPAPADRFVQRVSEEVKRWRSLSTNGFSFLGCRR